MTLSPFESRNVEGMAGDAYPAFTVGPVCCHPTCSKYADAAHHLVRRSQLAGAFHWVKLEDGTILGNVVPVCHSHHLELTDNQSKIAWLAGEFVWIGNTGEICGAISQPPIHGKPHTGRVTSHSNGPASQPTCETCGRTLPHKHEGPREPARRRKSWTVTVPGDAEDGALVLDVLVDECRKIFGHGEEKNLRYITLCQALALVLENQSAMLKDMS